MIHLICATSKEAKPLIDLYRLKKDRESDQFQIFRNENKSLTISKIGKIYSAMSVTYTYNRFGANKNQVWINFGLAGHKTFRIGELFYVDKIIDNDTDIQNFPYVHESVNLRMNTCRTFSKPNKYLDDNLSDMECSGFFDAANFFSSKELIHSLKIISDNKINSIDFNNGELIYDIINKKINLISGFIEEIESLWNEFFSKKQIVDQKIKEVVEKLNASFYEKNVISKLAKEYFYKFNRLDLDIFDYSKNTTQNIEILKRKINEI